MDQVSDIKPAFGDGTNSTDVVIFTSDTTARNAALPTAFAGQFVRIRAVGANLFYYFSASPTAAVDRTQLGSATGAQGATRGEYLPSGELLNIKVPGTGGNTVYFVWQCDAAGTGVWVTKASGIPGVSGGDR